MANSLDDVFIQKIILLATGVPGTVAMRDQITRLYEETGNLSKVAVFIDELMAKLSSENGRDVNDTVQVIFDNGFSLNLTTQKIEWLIADSLRQGIDSWSEFFFYTISDSEKKLDKILDNRAEAADVFTDLVDQLNVEVDVNDPLVHAWVDRVDESDRSLEVAKETVQELIDQLTHPPRLISSNPTDDAIQVAIDQNVVLTFSEPVKAGIGNIMISNGQDDSRTIAVTDSSQVTFNGNTVTINPTSDLSLNAAYHVQLASGVISDLAGNPYAGISDASTLNFNTVDTIVPLLISSNPTDDAVQVAIGSNIVLTFSELVKAGIGNIVISDGQDDSRTIAVTDSSQVTFNGNTVTINPTSDLSLNANYHVQLASGVITDLAGNPYEGISDATTLNFKTVDTIVPLLISSNPTDDAVQVAIGSNIVLTFSESVKAGIGNIVISDGQDDIRTIAVIDSRQVTFDGNTVIINPTSDLNPNATYHVQLASGVITDLVGNAYAGINDSTTLNFSTVDTLPPVIAPGQAFSYVESVLRDIEGLYLDTNGPINDTNDVIGTVVATDNTGVTSFAIVGGNNSDYFTIDELGRLRLTETGLFAASNDFERQPNAFNLTITAADGEGNISAPEVITVNVTNNPADDSPIILPGQTFSYVESILQDDGELYLDPDGPINDSEDVIGIVQAEDDTGVILFAIVDGDTNNYFDIDNNGRLTLTDAGLTSVSNDFEQLPNTFNLAITAVDRDRNTSEREVVVINVTNNPVDDPDTTPPVVAPGQVFSYEEAILAVEFGLIGPINDSKDVIGIVEAEDDTGVTSFDIVGGDVNNYFAIDELGRLTLTAAGLTAASNDFEVLPNEFNLNITATDDAGNISEPRMIMINVTNNPIDDPDTAPPTINSGQTFSYVESFLADGSLQGPIDEITDLIGTVAATDNIGVTSFAIVGGDDDNYFEIDNNGRLTLTSTGLTAASNDFEKPPNEFYLNITAKDEAGNISLAEIVTVNILDNPSHEILVYLTPDPEIIEGTIDRERFMAYPWGDSLIPTLQNADDIDGGDGYDQLQINYAGLVGVVSPAVQNIESISIFETLADGSGNLQLDMSNFIGVKDISINNSFFGPHTGQVDLTNIRNIINLDVHNSDSFYENDINIGFSDNALTGTADVLNLLLDNVETEIVINNTTRGTLEEISLNSIGDSSLSSQNIFTLRGSAVGEIQRIVITGYFPLWLKIDDYGASLLTVDASDSTANNDLDIYALGKVKVIGGLGNDIIGGGSDADEMYGGDGDDKVYGIDGDDVIYGGRGDDEINGGEGDDVIYGDLGNDIITGGLGADVLDGNAGAGDSTFEIDTFQFEAQDSLNTMLDHVYLGVNDILDLPIDITTVTQLNPIPSSEEATADSLAADIATLVNNAGAAFDQSGDTIIFRLDGPSVAGENVYYVVQNQGDDPTYDPSVDTVIALIGHPPPPVPGVFDYVFWRVESGNLILDSGFLIN